MEETGKDKVLEAIAVLEKRDDVLYAGPDYVLSVSFTTANDTYYSQQWALRAKKCGVSRKKVFQLTVSRLS